MSSSPNHLSLPHHQDVDGTASHTILLIDDDRDMHALCRHYVIKAGYQLISAYSGAEGLERICSQKIDLVLLDAVLPDKGGYAVFKELMTDSRYEHSRDLPVIILTAYPDSDGHKLELMELGLSMYIAKPFGGPELIKVIQSEFVASQLRKRERAMQPAHPWQDSELTIVSGVPEGIPSAALAGRVISESETLDDKLAPLQNADMPLREARQRWVEKFERTYLIELLNRYNGNISRVARQAGVHRMTIYRMLKNYDILITPRRAH